MIASLERPVRSAEKPAQSQRDDGGGVRLRFDGVAKPCVESSRSLSGHVSGLAVQILSCPCGLIHYAFGSGLGVTRDFAKPFLNFPAKRSGGPFNSIFIHDHTPVLCLNTVHG